MTDAAWLKEIRAAAVALGTTIVILSPHGSDGEPIEIDGRPEASAAPATPHAGRAAILRAAGLPEEQIAKELGT